MAKLVNLAIAVLSSSTDFLLPQEGGTLEERTRGWPRPEKMARVAAGHFVISGVWRLSPYCPPISFLNWSKSTCMPLKMVLQWRVSADMATASWISWSVAPACLAFSVSDQMQ